MKKIHLLLSCLAALMLGGCTLMMDEIPAEETPSTVDFENVGFDEPYTNETEWGTVTFQYGDSTKVLRKAVLDYLVKVEADSIFYFTDNIPTELLIQPGYYASMVATHEIPTGLCSKVLSLTKENGMYKMVTTRTSEFNVFKELDADLSLDLVQLHDITIPDSAECVAQGMDPDNPVIYNFDMLDGVMTKASVAKERATRAAEDFANRLDTRSGDGDVDDEVDFSVIEEGYKKDAYKEETNSKSVTLFSVSTVDPKDFEKKLPTLWNSLDWLNKHGLGLSFSLKYNTDVTVLYSINKDKGTGKICREETTIDRSSFVSKLDVTEAYNKDILDSKTAKSIYSKIGTQLKEKFEEQLKDQNSWISKIKNSLNTKDKSIVVTFPIAAWPGAAVFIRLAPEVQFAIGGVGSFSVHVTKPAVVSRVVYEDDELVEEDKPEKQGSTSTSWDWSLCGNATFQIGVELLAGISSMGKKTLSGLGVGGALYGKISGTFDTNIITGKASTNNEITLGLYFQGKARAFFLGSSVPVNIGPELPIADQKYPYGPSLDDKNTAELNVLQDETGKTYEYTGSFRYGSLGLAGKNSPEKFRPHMCIYYADHEMEAKDLEKADFVDMECLEKVTKCQKGISYNFQYTSKKALGAYCYMVPGFRETDGSGLDYLDKNTLVGLSSEPKMTNVGLYLVSSEPSDKPDMKWKYHIVLKVRLKNVHLMDSNWKEYGAYIYELYDEKAAMISPSLIDPSQNDTLWDPIARIKHKYYPINADHYRNGIYYYNFNYYTNVLDKTRFVMGGYYIRKGSDYPTEATNEGKKWYASDVYELEVNSKSEPNFKQDSSIGGGGTIGRLSPHDR